MVDGAFGCQGQALDLGDFFCEEVLSRGRFELVMDCLEWVYGVVQSVFLVHGSDYGGYESHADGDGVSAVSDFVGEMMFIASDEVGVNLPEGEFAALVE